MHTSVVYAVSHLHSHSHISLCSSDTTHTLSFVPPFKMFLFAQLLLTILEPFPAGGVYRHPF